MNRKTFWLFSRSIHDKLFKVRQLDCISDFLESPPKVSGGFEHSSRQVLAFFFTTVTVAQIMMGKLKTSKNLALKKF